MFLQTEKGERELDITESSRLRSGQRAEVTAGGGVTVLEAKEVAAASTATSCPTTGEQKIVVILASFPSKALLSSVTPDLMRAGFFGTWQSVDGFLREGSLGRAWATAMCSVHWCSGHVRTIPVPEWVHGLLD